MNLNALTVGQYFPGKSLLHRLDPRTKILAVITLSVAIFLPKAWPGYTLMALLVLCSVALAQVPILFILRGLRPIMIFLAITVVFNAFLTPGEPILVIGKWDITREGLVLSVVAAVRLIMLVVVASLLTLTTSPIRLTDGFERLLRPFSPLGVPAHELALMMTIALRFIPTLADEADRIMKAQAARGADFQSGNAVSRIKGLVPVMVPLFVAAFRRADDLATAMEARGYRGGKGRTKMRELEFTGRDLVALVLVGAVLAGVIYLRVTGLG
ncbi:MAG TPA: energy-coupling factor transporter transmembrane protein EcfT [Symbiobacteriaceae bacterium]|nr:energy-coupling factor transporter transmembrane protein EcfT [Symbiobacteriaceae bacterium]